MTTLNHLFGDIFIFNLHGLLGVASAFFDVSVGLIVFLNYPKKKLNQAFFLLSISTSIWVFFFGLLKLTKLEILVYVFLRLAYTGGVPFIAVGFYYFSQTLRQKPVKKPILGAAYTWATLATLPVIIAPKLFFDIDYFSYGRYVSYRTTPVGLAYVLFLLVPFYSFSLTAAVNLFQSWKRAVSPREKVQCRNIFIGFLLAYTGSVDFIAALHVPVYPFGFLSLALFIGMVAYTIARHQIFDINVMAKKFATIVLIYSFLISLTVPLTFHLVRKLTDGQLGLVLGLSLFWGILLSLGPLIFAYLTKQGFWLRSKSTTGLTHELKSPLGTIQNAAEALTRLHGLPTLEKEKSLTYLQMIENNAARLELYINDLLKLAKIQNDEITLEKKEIDLKTVLEETISAYELPAQSKNLSFNTTLSDLPALQLDKNRIQQAFSNILSNAVKFSKDDVININLTNNTGHIAVAVKDNGVGIQRNDLEKVFTRFYQGKNSTNGSGIGLTIAKAWVEAHGGKIWAESAGEGKGATVTFTLPV